MNDSIVQILNWLGEYYVSLVSTLLVLVFYVVINRVTQPRLAESVDRSRLKPGSMLRARYSVRLIVGLICVSALLLIWGVDIGGLLFFSTTLLTLTGVALFASWSLLSNITAFMVLLMHNSYRRGNFIRVVDADNYLEGYISEINLFSTKLITDDREVIIYPNNLLLARPTVINPRSHRKPMGKIHLREEEEKEKEKEEKAAAP